MMMTINIVMIVVGDYNTHRDDNNSSNNQNYCHYCFCWYYYYHNDNNHPPPPHHHHHHYSCYHWYSWGLLLSLLLRMCITLYITTLHVYIYVYVYICIYVYMCWSMPRFWSSFGVRQNSCHDAGTFTPLELERAHLHLQVKGRSSAIGSGARCAGLPLMACL